MLFDVKVQVELKNGVLDTAGKAVSKSLTAQGFNHVERSIRIGKTIRLQIEALSEAEAALEVEKMCEALFANAVIEQYEFSLEEV